MTATDELRRMLDERGVEWAPDEIDGFEVTRWRDSRGAPVVTLGDGFVDFLIDLYWQPTPEQAIEATLGRGTCKSVDKTDPAVWFVCSECGYGRDGIEFVPRYCPNCGRRVVAGDAS